MVINTPNMDIAVMQISLMILVSTVVATPSTISAFVTNAVMKVEPKITKILNIKKPRRVFLRIPSRHVYIAIAQGPRKELTADMII
jgi:hypothetical protein